MQQSIEALSPYATPALTPVRRPFSLICSLVSSSTLRVALQYTTVIWAPEFSCASMMVLRSMLKMMLVPIITT